MRSVQIWLRGDSARLVQLGYWNSSQPEVKLKSAPATLPSASAYTAPIEIDRLDPGQINNLLTRHKIGSLAYGILGKFPEPRMLNNRLKRTKYGNPTEDVRRPCSIRHEHGGIA